MFIPIYSLVKEAHSLPRTHVTIELDSAGASTQMDALTVIGIFMLGAAAGSMVSYAHHRRIVLQYRKLVEHLAEISDTEVSAGQQAVSES